MALGESEIRHLEMLQNVISRMATNSSNLKTWSVTLLAGIFALSAKDADRHFLAVAMLPAISFWLLDSYFLMQERRYRMLYDDVRQQSLDRPIESFSMNTRAYRDDATFLSAAFSRTIAAFYGAIILIVSLVSLLIGPA